MFQAEPTCCSHILVLLLRVICVRGGGGEAAGRERGACCILSMASQQITNIVLFQSPSSFPGTLWPLSSGKLGRQACTQLPTALAEALGRAWPNGTLMNSRPVGLARRRSWAQAMKGGGKKAENWPLVMETYAGPIASDKQVLGELCLVETKSIQNPSWLLAVAGFPQTAVSGESCRPYGLGNAREPWEPWGATGSLRVLWKDTGSLQGPCGATKILWGGGRSSGSLINALPCLGPSLRLAWLAHP